MLTATMTASSTRGAIVRDGRTITKTKIGVDKEVDASVGDTVGATYKKRKFDYIAKRSTVYYI